MSSLSLPFSISRYHGGWVAPNIYYLGAAGCVDVGGLTIAGISGIYKSHDYTLGRFETMPYNHSTLRSIYHTRHFDTYRLHLLSKIATQKPDIVLSHDWPNTIEQRGDVNWLKKRKPFFVDEINTASLGSPPLWKLLTDLCPKYWFAAHLHVRFAALYKHNGQVTQVKGSSLQNIESDAPARPEDSFDESVETKGNAEEMAIDMSDGEEEANPEAIEIDDDDLDEDPPHTHNGSSSLSQEQGETSQESGATRFLALSKCLQGQDFLQILEVPAPFDTQEAYQREVPVVEGQEGTLSAKQPSFEYNVPWLAVTRATQEYLSLEKRQKQLPDEVGFTLQAKEQEEWIKKRVTELEGENVLDIERTQQFVKTAPASNDQDGQLGGPRECLSIRRFESIALILWHSAAPWYTNPQTVALCSLLGTENRINPPPSVAPVPASFPAAIHNGLPPRPAAVPNGLAPRPMLSEEEEIRRIEDAAQIAMKRKRQQQEEQQSEVMTLLDDEDEASSRWKEGSG
jgi:lariat debranching enzyme